MRSRLCIFLYALSSLLKTLCVAKSQNIKKKSVVVLRPKLDYLFRNSVEEQNFFYSPKCPGRLWSPPNHPTQWVLEFFQGVSWLWRQFNHSTTSSRAWGSVVVKAASRKVPGSIPGRVTGDFFRSIRQVHVPGVDSASKNVYQDIPGGKGGRGIRVTTLPPSCAECLEIWEP